LVAYRINKSRKTQRTERERCSRTEYPLHGELESAGHSRIVADSRVFFTRRGNKPYWNTERTPAWQNGLANYLRSSQPAKPVLSRSPPTAVMFVSRMSSVFSRCIDSSLGSEASVRSVLDAISVCSFPRD